MSDQGNRYTELGYEEIILEEEPARRGLWYRANEDTIEICAGREGDDAYVKLSIGQVIDKDTFRALDSCLNWGAYIRSELS